MIGRRFKRTKPQLRNRSENKFSNRPISRRTDGQLKITDAIETLRSNPLKAISMAGLIKAEQKVNVGIARSLILVMGILITCCRYLPTYLSIYPPTYLPTASILLSLDNFNDYYIRGLHYNNLDSFWLSIFIRGLNCNTVDNVWLVIGIMPWFVMQDLDHITSLHIGNKLW